MIVDSILLAILLWNFFLSGPHHEIEQEELQQVHTSLQNASQNYDEYEHPVPRQSIGVRIHVVRAQ